MVEHEEVWENRRAAVKFLSNIGLLQRDVVVRVAELSSGFGQTDPLPVGTAVDTPKPLKKLSALKAASKSSSKRTKKVGFECAPLVHQLAETSQFPWVTAPFSTAIDAGQASWLELVKPQHLVHGLIVAELVDGIGISTVAQVCEGSIWLPKETGPTYSLPDCDCWVLSQRGLDALGDQLVADDWPAYFQPAPRVKPSGGFAIQRPSRDQGIRPSAPAGTCLSPHYSPPVLSAVSLTDSFLERLRAESQPVDRRLADRLRLAASLRVNSYTI